MWKIIRSVIGEDTLQTYNPRRRLAKDVSQLHPANRACFDSASVSAVILAASVLLLVAMLYPSSLLRWLQRKRYQYEVTFSLYMLTPTEKFIFNSILFLLLSLFIIAASLYLPEHITIIANRMFYYWFGDEESLNGASNAAQQVLATSSNILREAATQFLGNDNINQRMVGSGGLTGNGRAYMEP
ncbi:hypothetical protein K469DRAFT_690548 [Zopfia rhizophila CBS 207.26]|uniref:Uncharacterized protein n=1 Tax=Zopfia rhizophila CBS 207.26 TaxID=1314779 RepID=A0A6A6DT29_9PEZI|nr:hypothetical protein K469DRAFT_690548 [Zopfia rhizophila CBS 207.26]